MHQGNRPRDLGDISHLYLSTSRKKGEEAQGYTALVLLASLGNGPLRAWLSAGLASAFGAQTASVTLLDAGQSLPNAGYYFALGPERYLRPVLDEGALVETDAGGGVKVLCARDPVLLKYREEGTAAKLRVVMLAFEWQGADFTGGLRDILGSVPTDIPAFLLTVSQCYPQGAEGILRSFEDIYPGGPALALFPGGEEVRDKVIEPCPFPAEMLKGLSRRKPPASPFLSGLAGEIMQRLGSRKRGAADGGTR